MLCVEEGGQCVIENGIQNYTEYLEKLLAIKLMQYINQEQGAVVQTYSVFICFELIEGCEAAVTELINSVAGEMDVY